MLVPPCWLDIQPEYFATSSHDVPSVRSAIREADAAHKGIAAPFVIGSCGFPRLGVLDESRPHSGLCACRPGNVVRGVAVSRPAGRTSTSTPPVAGSRCGWRRSMVPISRTSRFSGPKLTCSRTALAITITPRPAPRTVTSRRLSGAGTLAGVGWMKNSFQTISQEKGIERSRRPNVPAPDGPATMAPNSGRVWRQVVCLH